MATEKQLKLAHRLAQSIAEYTGHDTREIMQEGKNRAMRRGFPMMANENGDPIGGSIKEASTEEMGHLIEELYQLGAEVGALYQE